MVVKRAFSRFRFFNNFLIKPHTFYFFPWKQHADGEGGFRFRRRRTQEDDRAVQRAEGAVPESSV